MLDILPTDHVNLVHVFLYFHGQCIVNILSVDGDTYDTLILASKHSKAFYLNSAWLNTDCMNMMYCTDTH